MQNVIEVNNLSKEFKIKKFKSNFSFLENSFFTANYEICSAIKCLSFSIKPGERVAFLGANGAGKSTAIKILTGILYPTEGDVFVHGLIPVKQRKELAYKIGIIFGQRSQLWYHLPSRETYNLLSKIYSIPPKVYRQRLDEIVKVLELVDIIDKAVRQLSLGQRMRCEIGAALLHHPSILFLDEPTIGIDINSKMAIRDYLNILSKQYGTTIFLTSHDIGDIENVCDRAIILQQGQKIVDQSIDILKENFLNLKRIALKTSQEKITIQMEGVKIIESAPHSAVLEISSAQCSIEKVVSSILSNYTVYDISIVNPPLEEIIRNIFQRN